MDAGSTAAPPDASAGEALRCILRTDGRFHALMQVAAVAVLVAFAMMFPRGDAALWWTVRATGPGLWLAMFVAGMVAQTALHEGAHALVFRLAGLPAVCGVLVLRGVPLGGYCRPLAPVPRPVLLASLLAPQVFVRGAHDARRPAPRRAPGAADAVEGPSMRRTTAACPLQATLPRTGAVLADRVLVATGPASMRGLLGRDCLAPGEALYFPAATFGALHSIGMRFAFDALYLDRRGVVRRVLRAVPPGRLCPWDLWTVAALELPAGAVADVRRGDVVRIGPAGAPPEGAATAPAP